MHKALPVLPLSWRMATFTWSEAKVLQPVIDSKSSRVRGVIGSADAGANAAIAATMANIVRHGRIIP